MKHPYLKICRVLDLETAEKLVESGISYIGFHIINDSDLTLLENYGKIDEYLKNKYNFYGSVLVTKIRNSKILRESIFKSSFSNIQLHYLLTNELLDFLIEIKKDKNLFMVYDPKLKQNAYFKKIKNIADYIILDNIEGGLGITIDIDEDLDLSGNTFFIAGGVNLDNIKNLYSKYFPFGFDIQSSCELSKGVKNFEYIKELIKISKYELE